MTLAELRQFRGFTQSDMAEKLHVDQSRLSRIESSWDLKVSSVERYVKTLGYQIHIEARHPGGSITIDIGRRPKTGKKR